MPPDVSPSPDDLVWVHQGNARRHWALLQRKQPETIKRQRVCRQCGGRDFVFQPRVLRIAPLLAIQLDLFLKPNGHDWYPEQRIVFAQEAQALRFVRYANKALEHGVVVTDAGEIT